MDETIQKAIGKLEKLVEDKSEALNTVNIAVNKFVELKNEYIVRSNELRITTDFKEVLGLSKAATEKQQQAYIDTELKELLQEVRIAEENVKSWKREVDLLNDKITVAKYQIKLLEN
ncbi:MAG: hypothetical protein ACI389_02390 [Methanobrevibacter sp.]|uniref:hypothetical protein n=1 Tax=Methanobrevibacter sp. TaxID=66852 RepID=UPI003F002297